jgi:hypothetical protein
MVGCPILPPLFGGEGWDTAESYFTTPKVNVVVECVAPPGRTTVVGKSGWFGESG